MKNHKVVCLSVLNHDFKNIDETLAVFENAGVELIVSTYLFEKFKTKHDYFISTGFKFEKTFDVLDGVDFDYVFLFDSDLILQKDFDPAGFIDIMHRNHLDLAQPALTKNSHSSWPITKKDENVLKMGYVGRHTNFVEMMAPVYSRRGWEILKEYHNRYNNSGANREESCIRFGRDFVNVGNRGIIDSMTVHHWKPIIKKDYNRLNKEKWDFFSSTGARQYPPQNQGFLV